MPSMWAAARIAVKRMSAWQGIRVGEIPRALAPEGTKQPVALPCGLVGRVPGPGQPNRDKSVGMDLLRSIVAEVARKSKEYAQKSYDNVCCSGREVCSEEDSQGFVQGHLACLCTRF